MQIRPGRLYSGLLTASFLLGATVPASAQGRFEVRYAQPPAEIEPLVAAIRQAGVIEEAAGYVNAALLLPRDVPISFESCGQPNAFYSPDLEAIAFCYEFIGQFAQIYGSDPEEYRDLVREDRLPEARAVRCPGEFDQKSESWDRLLWEHYTPAMRQ